MFDNISAARERLPEPAHDRPEEVDNALRLGKRVGYEVGEPLAECGYEEYPSDLLDPSVNRGLLLQVAEHERVGSINDVADELNASVDTVETALELRGISVTDATHEDPTNAMPVPLVDEPVPLDHFTDDPVDDQRLLHHLAVACGLGVSEIVEYLNVFVSDARERDYSTDSTAVKDTLKRINLLSGPTSSEREQQIRDAGPAADEINRNRDLLTVNTSDV